MSDRLLSALLGSAVLQVLLPLAAESQVFDLRELNTGQIAGLNLSRTVVVIPGGILEEHGPYLPSYTDGYVHEFFAQKIAEAIVARPGWTVLMFPTIPLGAGGGNQVGKKQIFPGTYHIHFSTLRAVYMDLASELGEAGFRWIFLVDQHGAPGRAHGRALSQTCDYFNETYGGKMVYLAGIELPSTTSPNLRLNDQERQENGLDVHAGMNETSRVLFLRPDLVESGYQNAQPHTGQTWRDLVNEGSKPEWPGYFGSPRLATAWRGAEILQARARDLSDMALRIIDGFDPGSLSTMGNPQARIVEVKRFLRTLSGIVEIAERFKKDWRQPPHGAPAFPARLNQAAALRFPIAVLILNDDVLPRMAECPGETLRENRQWDGVLDGTGHRNARLTLGFLLI